MHDSARDIARGRWMGILGRWLDERTISGKQGPCPICGGKDRFRFDNKDGAGTWYCNHCGAGDGFHLLQHLNDWKFHEALKHVQSVAKSIQPSEVRSTSDPEKVRASLKRVWEGAVPLQPGDPVSTYLTQRCSIKEPPANVRYHADLAYRHEDGSITRHPAMIARIQNVTGQPVCLHRTYLTQDGQKVSFTPAKKLMTPTERLSNVAIRLDVPQDGWLGVAEGIETALCASAMYKVPVWALVCSGMMRSFRPSQEIKLLTIFADNDANFVGQSAANALAMLVSQQGVECRVCVPHVVGSDWADEMRDRQMRDRREAARNG